MASRYPDDLQRKRCCSPVCPSGWIRPAAWNPTAGESASFRSEGRCLRGALVVGSILVGELVPEVLVVVLQVHHLRNSGQIEALAQ